MKRMVQPVIGNLLSELSEEDRAFFLVLDIAFSQYHIAADLGYYYEAECEETFSFNRLKVASEHFYYYKCHQALQKSQRYYVKYINVSALGPLMAITDFKKIEAKPKCEFNLLHNHHGMGLVDIFLIISRVPSVYYLFMEKPDETLEDYLIRHSKNTLQYYSSHSQSFSPVVPIPLPISRFIMKSVASTLLKLHKKGVFHGRLSANSIFLIYQDSSTQSSCTLNKIPQKEDYHHQEQVIKSVKLANLSFAERVPRTKKKKKNNKKEWNNNKNENNHEQMQLDDILRTRELVSLYDLIVRILECTEFNTYGERERFFELASVLIMPMLEQSVEFTVERSLTNVIFDPININSSCYRFGQNSNNGKEFLLSIPESRLEVFVKSL